MRPLPVAEGFSLPAGFITMTAAVLAKRRIGKTYNSSVIAEEFVAAGLPFVTLDPTSAWWGLRASADGKKVGLPVTIIGGEYGDVPIDVTDGRAIADLVIEEPSFYVIDLGHWESDSEHRRFAAPFLERIYRGKAKRRDPLHLFVDEADVFAPQKPQKGDEQMLHHMQSIVRRGGLRGLGSTLITQRAAVLNKDVLTQLDLLIILRTIAPQDQDAVEDYVKRGAPAERAEIMDSLASLKPGEAWVYGPGEDPPIVERVQFRRRRTFNSSATPDGREATEPRKLADVDLVKVRERLAKTIEKAKADDPKELRRQIAALRKQLDVQPATVAPERVEVPIVTDDARRALEAVHATAADALDLLTTTVTEAREHLASVAGQITSSQPAPARTPPRAAGGRDRQGAAHASSPAARRPSRPAQDPPVGATALGGAPKAFLLTLISHQPRRLTRAEMCTLSGYKPKSSTTRNAFSTLRTAGYLDEAGGTFGPTDAAVHDYGDAAPAAPTTTDELLAVWRATFGGAPRAFFDRLVDAYPDPVAREDLAEETGYSLTSSTFRNAVSALRTNGLLEDEPGGAYRASDALFLTGAPA